MKKDPLYIDIHVLQTVPPSNINRDDTGSPKTARFGGVTRARVSSQAWKKAMRDRFATMLDVSELGQRTKYISNLIVSEMKTIDPSIEHDEAEKKAETLLKEKVFQTKKGNSEKIFEKDDKGQERLSALFFISPAEVKKLAELALKSNTKLALADVKKMMNASRAAIDVAMFGRMAASDPTLNVDAAVQVAHALGVSKAETEYDYFTAMDDLSPEDNTGAAMIETIEFLSAMFYRYATVDVYHLCENLGSHMAARRAVEAFIKAFLTSMPTGKQNSFANRTMPSAVMVTLRDSQPVNLVNAFERPVVSQGEKGILEVACERLIGQENYIESAFGLAPAKIYVMCAGEGAECLGDLPDAVSCNMKSLIEGIGQQVEAYLDSTDLPPEIGEQ